MWEDIWGFNLFRLLSDHFAFNFSGSHSGPLTSLAVNSGGGINKTLLETCFYTSLGQTLNNSVCCACSLSGFFTFILFQADPREGSRDSLLPARASRDIPRCSSRDIPRCPSQVSLLSIPGHSLSQGLTSSRCFIPSSPGGFACSPASVPAKTRSSQVGNPKGTGCPWASACSSVCQNTGATPLQ